MACYNPGILHHQDYRRMLSRGHTVQCCCHAHAKPASRIMCHAQQAATHDLELINTLLPSW